jgi:putative Mg2+ transporter-C (MgtC) family protein
MTLADLLPAGLLPPGFGRSVLDLVVAMACGALIGSERQIRQRMAGLRTNALVALGAASFVTFSTLFPAEVSPTRVAAQIVSGIGFLGAGLIFRDGLTLYGINTAATLWCSAAVGMMAGAGAFPHAVALTVLVVFVNLGLRPLVKALKRHTAAGRPALQRWRVALSVPPEQEAAARALLLRTVSLGGLRLARIEQRPSPDRAGAVDLLAEVTGEAATPAAVEQALSRLAAEPGLLRVEWTAAEEA